MSLQSLLLPNEQIMFRTSRPVMYGQSRYNAYVTNVRFILHAQRGLFPRDDLVAYKLTDLHHFKYHEEGLIFRTGVLTITLPNSFNKIRGPTADMKQLYQHAMGLAHAGTPRAL